MKALPEQVRMYNRSGSFTRATMPRGYLHDHSTQAGVWAKVVVEQGSVRFVVEDGVSEGASSILRPGDVGVVEPLVRHHVEMLDDDTCFHLEFYR